MRARNLVQTYMIIGAIFGVILAGPLWYLALFGYAVPSNAAQVQALVVRLLLATIAGVFRAFAWLPSLVYHVGMHKVPFMHWLLTGWW